MQKINKQIQDSGKDLHKELIQIKQDRFYGLVNPLLSDEEPVEEIISKLKKPNYTLVNKLSNL